MKYDDQYGDWAGRPKGDKPDYSRCAASVYPGNSMIDKQCANKAKFDTDENGRPTTCGIHKGQENPFLT